MADHTDPGVSRRDWLRQATAIVAGGAASVSGAFVLADESLRQDISERTELTAEQRNLLELLEAAPGGSGIDKRYYLQKVGNGNQQIRFHYDVADVAEMSSEHAAGTLKVAGFVWSPAVRAHMWFQALEDIADGPAEMGGIIVDDPRKPFLGIRNDADRDMRYVDRFGSRVIKSGSGSRSYALPEIIAENVPHIGEYHLHIDKKEGRAREEFGPSASRYLSPNSYNGFGGDLGYAAYRIKEKGRTHQIVVSLSEAAGVERLDQQPEIPEGAQGLNFHYFGGEKSKDGQIQVYVLNLGTFYNDTHYPLSEILRR
jgi:hypothetical protein